MWFKDEPLVVKRRKPNRRRRAQRQPLLMVNARSSDKRRARTQKTTAILMSSVVLIGLVWVSVAGLRWVQRALFSENRQYVIRNLDLSSDGSILKDRYIKEYAHISEGMNLFAIDLDEVRRNLMSVPIVAAAEISRRLPDTLIVRLSERLALARLGYDDRKHHLAIDREGHILGPSSRRPDLPAITGIPDPGYRPGDHIDAKLVQDALTMLDICDTTRLNQVIQVSRVNVRHPDYLDLELAGGEHVLLGRDRLEWRLKWLARSLQTAVGLGKQIASIDLTVNKNPPVQWR